MECSTNPQNPESSTKPRSKKSSSSTITTTTKKDHTPSRPSPLQEMATLAPSPSPPLSPFPPELSSLPSALIGVVSPFETPVFNRSPSPSPSPHDTSAKVAVSVSGYVSAASSRSYTAERRAYEAASEQEKLRIDGDCLMEEIKSMREELALLGTQVCGSDAGDRGDGVAGEEGDEHAEDEVVEGETAEERVQRLAKVVDRLWCLLRDVYVKEQGGDAENEPYDADNEDGYVGKGKGRAESATASQALIVRGQHDDESLGLSPTEPEVDAPARYAEWLGERLREAEEARDKALKERDELVEKQQALKAEHAQLSWLGTCLREAEADRDEAEKGRDKAIEQRDELDAKHQALKAEHAEVSWLVSCLREAEEARDKAQADRDEAVSQRDEILAKHQAHTKVHAELALAMSESAAAHQWKDEVLNAYKGVVDEWDNVYGASEAQNEVLLAMVDDKDAVIAELKEQRAEFTRGIGEDLVHKWVPDDDHEGALEDLDEMIAYDELLIMAQGQPAFDMQFDTTSPPDNHELSRVESWISPESEQADMENDSDMKNNNDVEDDKDMKDDNDIEDENDIEDDNDIENENDMEDENDIDDESDSDDDDEEVVEELVYFRELVAMGTQASMAFVWNLLFMLGWAARETSQQ